MYFSKKNLMLIKNVQIMGEYSDKKIENPELKGEKKWRIRLNQEKKSRSNTNGDWKIFTGAIMIGSKILAKLRN
jgi:hypothetical protein